METIQYNYLRDKAIVEDRKYRGCFIFFLSVALVLAIISIVLYTIGNECWRIVGGFALIFFLVRYIFHIISYTNKLKKYMKQNMSYEDILQKLF